ncbi:RNA-binding domain-containing protein [Cryphonectria parasitica EP155]|uniref:RNA-binding domain-containing protein n=1 Tax=Cryphonectria parasitica (strain ATCC 38755 / EP155) TaxID=660469 RepID=A0A9P4XX52_CRYP1|nr:RNA-binding domain-containing protein [Cryphonectria parasitica EP155]KAF3762432.1 RNA-binding domain-containing protein [Cryphonectria parasitica EP155]
MDRSLDEILADRGQKDGGGRPRGRGGQRRREPRSDFPRDGVRKSYRDEGPRNLDSEWVHDRFEDNGIRRGPWLGRRHTDGEHSEEIGTKIRVDNVHYDLSEEDLSSLFHRIGPVLKLDIRYDRAGRSTGTVFVTYEVYEDAREAVRQFDGANAKGQPIRLSILPPRRRDDSSAMAGRPLSERITLGSGRNRSRSPVRDMEDEAARRNIDRYVPGGRRSRSPVRGRRRGEGGRRPGARRGGGNPREGTERQGRDARPKKTQEELDAEMEDYFTAQTASNAEGQTAAATAAEEDIDMIE